MKKYIILAIDESYANRYKLDSSFIGKKIVVYEDRYIHFEDHKSEYQ